MELRLPSFWKGMGFTAKAGYLCSTNQAKDYSDACRILAGLRRRKRTLTPPPAKPTQMRLPYADN